MNKKIIKMQTLLIIILLICSCTSESINNSSYNNNQSQISSHDTEPIVNIDDLNPIIETAEKYMMLSQSFTNENGKWIIRSNDKTLDGKTLDKYKEEQEELYRSVFTDRMIASIPLPDKNNDTYLYSIGLLSQSQYKCGEERGIDITYAFSDWELINVSDDEIKLINRSFYFSSPDEQDVPKLVFKNHKLIEEDTDKEYIPVNGERLETYSYKLIAENEKWKFDNFSLWR